MEKEVIVSGGQTVMPTVTHYSPLVEELSGVIPEKEIQDLDYVTYLVENNE